ncbi:MAG: trypsin-like serine protease [Desulfobacterales bacterium]
MKIFPYIVIIAFFGFCSPGFAETVQDADVLSHSSRIVGGREAATGEWPWMAALMHSWSSSYYSGQFCGGSLIHPNWVVTAGHCVWRKSPADVDVALNVHDLKNDTGERVNVKRIIVHPSYDNATLDFDIALLELEHSVSYETISPVSEDFVPENQLSITMGWGKTDYYTYSYSTVLMEVLIPIVSNETCNAAFNAYNALWYQDDITENMLCAGFAWGEKDACTGDSGGPLIVWDGSGWKLAGIVSWGEACALPNLYGVYAGVSKLIPFIRQYVPASAVLGDFDQNGRLGIEDVIAILQTVAGIRKENSVTPRIGDYDGDQSLSLKDAVCILQILAGSRLE